MKVGINASFLRKPATGIGQVTLHFLEELSKSPGVLSKTKAGNIEFVLYLEEEIDPSLGLSDRFTRKAFLPLLWKRDDLVRKILWEKYTLPRRAKKDGCDVLLSLYQSATVVPGKMKHVMLVHDIIPRLFPEYLGNARKRKYQDLIETAIAKADAIVTVSAKTKNDLVSHLGIGAKKITVSSIDVDPIFKKPVAVKRCAEVMKKYGLQPGYVYLGGGLEKRKNAEAFLRAYKRLVTMHKKEKFVPIIPKLVISGKLMPQLAPLIVDVEKLVKELNLSTRTKIIGFVPQEDLPALYAEAGVFVFPSLYEGFGLPVLEAMSQGTPVMTSKTTSLPEVGGDAVAYCDPESIEDMAETLKRLLSDAELRATLGARGKERSLEFSWGRFVATMIRTIRKVSSR